jgi:hypothetical protein
MPIDTLEKGKWYAWDDMNMAESAENMRDDYIDIGCVSEDTYNDRSFETGNAIYRATEVGTVGQLFDMHDAVSAACNAIGFKCYMVFKIN